MADLRFLMRRGVAEADAGGDTAPRRRCGASGWRLRDACTDGNGGAICPMCGQPVRAHRDHGIGGGVRVIQEHIA